MHIFGNVSGLSCRSPLSRVTGREPSLSRPSLGDLTFFQQFIHCYKDREIPSKSTDNPGSKAHALGFAKTGIRRYKKRRLDMHILLLHFGNKLE